MECLEGAFDAAVNIPELQTQVEAYVKDLSTVFLRGKSPSDCTGNRFPGPTLSCYLEASLTWANTALESGLSRRRSRFQCCLHVVTCGQGYLTQDVEEVAEVMARVVRLSSTNMPPTRPTDPP